MKKTICFMLMFGLVLGFTTFTGLGQMAVAANILTMSHTQVFGTIDPQRGTDYTETYAMINIYDTLVFPNSAGDMEPKLAESWESTPDGLTYKFTIRKGVKFHDGSELTGEDVVFSMHRSLALKEGYSWLWADILDKVTAQGNNVTFSLKQPFAPFVATLAWLYIANKDLIMAKKAPGDHGVFGDYGAKWLSVTTNEDAGSGPYKLKSWDRGRAIVFERFKDYFEGWPHGDKSIDEVHSIDIRENATVRTMLRKGELTLVEHWRTYADYQEMDKYPNAHVISFLSPEVLSFKINTKKPPTDDIHIRRMLAWAMDYDAVLNILEPGSAIARGPVPSAIPGHNPRLFRYTMDLEKAREELKKSKYYPNVPPIEVVLPEGLENRRMMALRFQQSLAALGVKLAINIEPWGRMTDLATTMETTPHIMIISVSANYPDADSYLYPMYHSKAAGTWMSTEWLQDPLVDQLIDQERVLLDPEERAHVINVLQHAIMERCPDIYVYTMALRVGVQNYLKGFTPRPVMSFYYYFHDWWYDK